MSCTLPSDSGELIAQALRTMFITDFGIPNCGLSSTDAIKILASLPQNIQLIDFSINRIGDEGTDLSSLTYF